MGLTVSQKVDNYAKSHVKELRDVENKNGRPMTKDDVVEYMMKKGELTQGDYNIWYSSIEGSNSRMNKLSRTSSVWTQTNSAIGGETQKSYLDDFNEDPCIPDLGKTYEKSVDKATKGKTTTFSVKREMEKQKFQDYLNSLPPVTASYTDLMRSIKFEKASPSERIDMMLQQAGERFQVAREQGDTNQMGKLLLDGLMLSFKKIDSELGITYVKEGMKNANIVRCIEQAVSAMVNDGDNSNTTSMEKFWNSIKESDAFQAVKSYGGFNDIIAQIDKLVDDGDPNNLGILEKSWDGLKGVGQFADNFVGTQGVVVLAAYALIMQAAVAGGGAIGAKVIGGEAGAIIGAARASQVIGAGFTGAGGYHTTIGAIDLINADTHEEAQAAGAKIAQGALEIYGGYRGLKAGIEMYKAGKFQQMKALEQENALAEARKLFGFEDGVEITETALKQAYKNASLRVHPDRGGTTEAFQAVNDAYGLLKDNLAAANKVTGFKTPATEPAPQNAPAQGGATETQLATRDNLAEFRNNGYNLMTTPQNQILAYDASGKTVEVGTLGKTSIAEVRANLQTVKLQSATGKLRGYDRQAASGHDEYTYRALAKGEKVTDSNCKVIVANGDEYLVTDQNGNTRVCTLDEVNDLISVVIETEGSAISRANMKASTLYEQEVNAGLEERGVTFTINKENSPYWGDEVIMTIKGETFKFNPQASYTTQDNYLSAKTEFLNTFKRVELYLANDPAYSNVRGYNTELFDILVERNSGIATPTTVTNVTGTVTTENGGLTVTRPNGTQVDLFAGIPQEVLNAPAKNYMKFPDATTIPENFGVSLTQHASAPIEAQYIPTGKTVAETLELANKSGVPLKFDVEKQAFYQDAPYGGKQYVNTESITPIYTHEAEPNRGLAKNYVQEYGHEVITPDGPKTYAVDRAVVTANPKPTDNGLSANCAGKQYDIVYPDGTRKPYSPDLVKPGEPFKISKREGVELKMAVFDKPTTSAEGETLPAGKLMMIDADGHPYNGIPVKRLRSGEVEMQFDETDPVQAQMKQTLDKIKDLDAQTKAAKEAGNKDLANQHKDKADALANELDAQLTEFVKAKQNPTAVESGTQLGNELPKTSTAPEAAKTSKAPSQSETPTTQASPEATWTEYMTANPELFGAKPKATPTSQNTQTPLIDNSRKPANLNPTVEEELNDYATKNNYELKYSKTGNAVFRNNDGKIVRRVDIDENGNLRNDRYFTARNESTVTGKKIASGTPIKNSLVKCKIPSNMQHTTGNIGNVTVNVALGDMTAIKADAFVVPELKTRVSNGGVGGAIWSRGAGKGMKAYEKHIKKHGKQEFGSVVVTDAGGGNSSKLLHTVTVGSGAENEFTTIQTAVYNALKTAQEQGMQSVVIPQMGTGIIGTLTSEQSAGAIMAGINQFNADGGKMDVSVVIYGSQNAYNTFTNSLQNHSYENATPETGAKEFNIAEFAQEMSK